MSTDPLSTVAERIEATFAAHEVVLTLGGEPTYVPENPEGAEWSVTALGPTKLAHAYALAAALQQQALPHAVDFYCPGKSYPGELNPRWAITLVWNRDGTPLFAASDSSAESDPSDFREALLPLLGLESGWLRAVDPFDEDRAVWVLPLDHEDGAFISEDWALGPDLTLLRTDGPAGLRLPMNELPADARRRALTVELRDDELHLFLPPLMQPGFLALLNACAVAASLCDAPHGAERRGYKVRFAGYLPGDDADRWSKLAIAADPGVLEINLPPCTTWMEYRDWLATLERATAACGLRSWKQTADGGQLGTGGGNHLLFGGPTLDTNPLFTRPRWVTSILRYWQHHPALSYLFTGQYVGASSQAPRPDEGPTDYYDLEMAYRFLEELPPGDHRYLISETLRHLHTDAGGNTHRSETSFDKFWNVAFDGGCRGLIEFRAVESFPRAEWMSAIALLWRAIAARLLATPFLAPLIEHGDALHDRYFLPGGLIADFDEVLADLRAAGFELPRAIFEQIIDWRCPVLLQSETGLIVRRALESWPLLCEQPLEGGSTSRFVDTSIERLEFT
ncbi:MAG: transglutaminase family protein, partial [Chthoniobacteraceae bacterium]